MQLTQRQVLPGSSQIVSNASTLRRNATAQRTGRGKLNYKFRHAIDELFSKLNFKRIALYNVN